jgi:DNA/RNA endonuclease G (NUC1)
MLSFNQMQPIRSFLLRMERVRFTSALRNLGLSLVLIFSSACGWAKQGIEFQMPLGNPDSATNNATFRTKYLIQKRQYALSYNDDTHQPNWVSWSYSTEDTGSQSRTDAWAVEELLPSGFLKISTATFGSPWDRGHMCPSADRTTNYEDNAQTFRMSNMIPQHANNNQGLWANFETYTRSLASGGNEILIITGPAEFTGATIANGMRIPGSVWKIAVVVPNASSTTPAPQRLTTSARVIAILTPNISTADGLINDWKAYRTSVEQIEQVTGFTFFAAVDPAVATYLKNVVDTGTGPNAPTVITSFSPSFGPASTPVTITGYNFGSNPSVEFDGTPATSVTVVNANTLTAVVPSGATTGNITVTGTGGMDTSASEYTVTGGGTSPTFFLSTSTLSGLTAGEGSAGASRVYTVTGSSLTSALTVTAPSNFEVSLNNSFFSASVSLAPTAGALSEVPVYVRIKAGAPVGAVTGNVTHVGGGATSQNLNVSGSVASTAPILTLSTTNLSGFTAVQGSAGGSKSYTISGNNLIGNITISAPSGYEVSLNNSVFAAEQTIAPAAGAIASMIIYARLSVSAPSGINTGSIIHSGGGATAQSVSVSGSVGEPGSEESWVATSGVNTKGAINTGQSFSGKSGVWINEFHYDTDGTDVGEFVEVVVGPDITAALTSIVLDFYNGSGGASYATHALSTFLLGSTVDGYRIFYKEIPGIQNGSPDGLGISIGGISVEFLSYEGIFAATSGPANGLTSVDIGISEPSTAPVGSSLQLTGSGTPASPSPVITVSGPVTVNALESFSYTIQASENPISYSASGLPEGLSINTSTGVISGTPITPGIYLVGLAATNAAGDGTGTLTLTVNPNPNAPVIGGTLTATAQVGSAFDYQIVASNSPTSYLAEGLPAGLSLHPTSGRITGAPTVSGSFAVALTAINADGSDTATLNLIIKNPSLTFSVPQLTGFSVNVGSASASQSYTLSGADLSGVITVTAPLHFEISLDGASYGSSLSLNPDGVGSLSMPLLVRLAASAPVGIHSGSISHTGGGATPSYLLLQGEAISITPVLLLSTNNLPAFGTTQGKPSMRQVYTASGSSLSGAITVSCPAGFELSLNDETYAATVTLTPATGTLPETSVYIRLTGASQGNFTGSLTHTGGGVANQLVAVTGEVTAAVGPPILSPLSGSVYASASFRHTIVAGGDTPVTYGASGLPGGWTVNASSGLVSGTASSSAGTVNFTVSATNAEGTTSATYTLKIVSTSEQNAIPLSVVINKMQYAVPDRIELLVVGNSSDAAAGPPVDLRGMILKDFVSSSSLDTGGRFVFRDIPFWSSVKAGTLIVLATGKTLTEDFDPSDFVLRVNLGNTAYFETAGGNFDLETNDMVMLKAAEYGMEGIAGGIHAVGIGANGSQYTGFSGKKTRARRAFSSNRGFYGYVLNNNASLSDFSANNAADLATSKTFGTGNTTGNTSYIGTLQAIDQTGPNITLTGANPLILALGATFADPGATATDTSGGSRPVTPSGSVNTAVAGSYTRSYTATDTLGNVSTVTRTVVVEKGTPVISTPPLASGLTEGQTLLAAMLSGGSATYGGVAVFGSFAWSLPSTQPAVGPSSQLVTFTPDDTSNYQAVTFSVNVTVNPAQTLIESWASQYDLSGIDAEPDADPDGDGLNNAQEYAFGLNPTNASANPAVLSQESSQVKLTFLQKDTGGITYAVKSASSLSGGFTNSVTPQEAADQTGVPTGYKRYEATMPTSTGRGFLKVEATIPP